MRTISVYPADNPVIQFTTQNAVVARDRIPSQPCARGHIHSCLLVMAV